MSTQERRHQPGQWRERIAAWEADGNSSAAQDRKYRRRWWTLAVLSVSLIVVIIDDSIINVALPTLQRDLNASASDLQWFVDAYVLSFAGLLLTMGALGDRFGRKRFLQLGLVIFGVSSVYAAYAGSTGNLIVGRALMGVGGALIMPSTLSVLIDVFPRAERVKAIGIWTGAASLGIPLGPVVGGWLLENFWWGSVFLLNLPIVLVALAAGWVLVPESRHPAPPRPDLPGLVLSAASLSLLVYGIIEAPTKGWMSAAVLGSVLAAVVIGATFVVHERRAPQPMLDVRLFENPRLAWGTVATILGSLALTGLVFELTQYLQTVQGYTPLEAGMRFLPLAAGFGIAGPVTPRIVQRIGTPRTVAAALGAVGVVLGAVAQLQAGSSYWLLGAALVLIGLGVGSAFVPSTDAVMAAVPEANAGLGSAINDTSRQVGAALGIGVLGALTNTAYRSNIGDSVSKLAPNLVVVTRQSAGAAIQLANKIGGSAGANLRRAATSAFMDGFALAALVSATLLVAGAVAVLRWLPSHDLAPQSPDTPQAREASSPGPAPITPVSAS